MERLTIKCEELFVPKKICTTDRFGEVDDCDACDSVCDSDCKNCAIQECFTRLGEYEDTSLTPEQIKGKAEALKIYQEQGLTPDQIRELKERDTAKAPENVQDAFGDGRLFCPNCRNSVINYFNRSRPPQFCMICGQRLKWED